MVKLRVVLSFFMLSFILATGTIMASDTDITFQDSPNPRISQTISLWNEGEIPAKTIWTSSTSNPDGKDFMPNIVSVPAADGAEIKGAVISIRAELFRTGATRRDCRLRRNSANTAINALW